MQRLHAVLLGLAVLVGVVLVGGCSHTPPAAPLPAELDSAERSVLVVADPQIHNVFGYRLKQMSRGANAVTKVAIRPPELNLLARHSLAYLLEEGVEDSSLVAPVIVLGDATNIACSSEFDEFAETMTETLGERMVWLMAHGNHDSYLMGTVNTYIPTDDEPNWQPEEMGSAYLPTDESWWGTPHAPKPGERPSWKSACYRSPAAGGGLAASGGSPMNKVRWLRMYMDVLESYGLELPAMTERVDSPVELDLTARPGSGLHDIGYRMQGEWVRPDFEAEPGESDFLRSYLSFVVQTAALSPHHHLLLIDTSVCELAPGGKQFWLFPQRNAGSKGCLGDRQLELIGRIVREVPSEKRLVLGGHFPLEDIADEDRQRLLDTLSVRQDWTYVSAHTHTTDRLVAFDWGEGAEINVGSTTDWPMTAHRLYLSDRSSFLWAKTSHVIPNTPGLQYVSRAGSPIELCRHLPVAAALASLDPASVGDRWESPQRDSGRMECDIATEEGWHETTEQLEGYRDTISKRFETEPEYRQAVLRIAAAASKHNSESFSLLDLVE